MPHIANVPGPTAAPSHASAPRRLQGGRKKANPAADDAAYHGASTSGVVGGTKRTAADKPEGEPRMKRKRVDMTMAGGNMGGGSASTSGLRRPDRPLNADGRPSLVSVVLRWLVGKAKDIRVGRGVIFAISHGSVPFRETELCPQPYTGPSLDFDWSNTVLADHICLPD